MVGIGAGAAATTATSSTFVGYFAGNAVTTGNNNTLIGLQSGKALTTTGDNTMVGYNAGQVATGASNTIVGSQAGNAITAGGTNTIIGNAAGQLLNVGGGNVIIGNAATTSGAGTNLSVSIGQSAVTATYSVALGYLASSTGNGSVAIGCDSGGAGASTAVNNEIKLGTANHTVNIPGALMAVGTNPAGTGTIRLPNNGSVYGRNATNTGDNCMFRAIGTGISLGGNVGFWGATPAAQDTGWNVVTYTPTRSVSSGITLTQCADALCTLITALKSYGILA